MGLLQIIKGVVSGKGEARRPPVVEKEPVRDKTSATQDIFGLSDDNSSQKKTGEDVSSSENHSGETKRKAQVLVQQTPNPRAFKFITDCPMKLSGRVTYNQKAQAEKNPLALALFDLPGVSQVHFFDNVVTVTFTEDVLITQAVDGVRAIMETMAPEHNPDFSDGIDEEKRREKLSPELKNIEEILDRTIRPGLRADGGDLEVLALEKNNLMVRYQGACGSCPSSTTGTLMAIENILRNEFSAELCVIAL